MPDRIETVQFPCVGGLVSNMDALQQGIDLPGSAIRLINHEPSTGGGYSRILGYTKFDNAAVPSSGVILGAFVFEQSVIACRGTNIYISTGSGWTAINGADTRTGAGFYRAAQYEFMGNRRIALVDGVNRPTSYSDTSTYAVLTNAPLGAEHVQEFRGRLWFAKGNLLTYSAPLADNDFTVPSGGGQINVSHEITGLAQFRNQLIVFGPNTIARITGDSAANFKFEPVAHNIGTEFPDSIVEANGDLFYMGPDGIRTFAATERNDDFNIASNSLHIQPQTLNLMNNYSRIVAIPIRGKSQVRFMGYESLIPRESSRGIIGAIQQQVNGRAWTFSETIGIKACCGDSEYNSDGNEVAVFGSDDGYVYRLESGNSFDGEVIAAIYQTPFISMSDVNARKSFRKVKVFFGDTSAYSIEVTLRLDFDQPSTIQPPTQVMEYTTGGTSYYGTGIYGTAVFGTTSTPYGELLLVGSGDSASLLFVSQAELPPYTIKSLALEISNYGRK